MASKKTETLTDLQYVTKLLKLIEESTVNEIELEEKGSKIRITKNVSSAMYQVAAPTLPQPQSMQQSAPVATSPTEKTEKSTPSSTEKKYHEVRSPIVGTFYRSPSPDASPYIEVGQSIKAGGVLCIVEAMKLMNEIESDVAGTIVKICVENGKPVEYNQVLFLVDKN